MEIPATSLIHQHLWGKADGEGEPYHPLFCHLADVGSVARALLTSPAASGVVRRFAVLLGIEPRAVPSAVAYLVALHDLGKASPSFQMKSSAQWERICATGLLPATPWPIADFRHDLEGNRVIGSLLDASGRFEVPGSATERGRFFAALAQGLGGHHGVFFPPGRGPGYPEIPVEDDPHERWRAPWQQARGELLHAVGEVFDSVAPPLSGRPGNLSALAVAIGGLTILCDWIGSDEAFFPPYSGDHAVYPELAQDRASRAMSSRHLLSFLPAGLVPPEFEQLFPGKSPRPLQRAMGTEGISHLPSSALVIIEAPMGEGKTEAALYLAARFAHQEDCSGFYFALPTMATSNQMFKRVEEFLRQQTPVGSQVGLHLLHGQAAISDQLTRLLEAAQHDGLAAEDAVVADSWLLPRKRSLLAPYGVGTVDQAMVAALNVKHGALRLFGLAGKVVVVDEVHAYDLYMSTILDRLLEWLRALGASVVLLSATLPQKRREQLITAFAGRPSPGAESPSKESYPLISIVDGTGADADQRSPARRIESVQVSHRRAVQIDRRRDGVGQRAANAQFLLEAVESGGCAVWICNTVGEAQECYRVLSRLTSELPVDKRPRLVLFHARFPLERRLAIENEVVDSFGKEGPRPECAIVVATQVVEQSLDLDFDLMLSQLAPVDLLLQRLGRLHRHDGRLRPLGLASPRLVLLDPEIDDGGRPHFGPSARVYQPWILLKTLVALHGRTTVDLPEDMRWLIEDVYDDTAPDVDRVRAVEIDLGVFTEARTKLEKHQAWLRSEAQSRVLKAPDPKGRFAADPPLSFDEESAELHHGVAAQTRLSDPSVRAILLDRNDPIVERVARAATERRSPDRELLVALLNRGVGIPHRALVDHVRAAATPASEHSGAVRSLERIRGLKGYYLIVLDGDRYTWTDGDWTYRLAVSEDLGIVIDREEGE